jgi:hypothetical protein
VYDRHRGLRAHPVDVTPDVLVQDEVSNDEETNTTEPIDQALEATTVELSHASGSGPPTSWSRIRVA